MPAPAEPPLPADVKSPPVSMAEFAAAMDGIERALADERQVAAARWRGAKRMHGLTVAAVLVLAGVCVAQAVFLKRYARESAEAQTRVQALIAEQQAAAEATSAAASAVAANAQTLTGVVAAASEVQANAAMQAAPRHAKLLHQRKKDKTKQSVPAGPNAH